MINKINNTSTNDHLKTLGKYTATGAIGAAAGAAISYIPRDAHSDVANGRYKLALAKRLKNPTPIR